MHVCGYVCMYIHVHYSPFRSFICTLRLHDENAIDKFYNSIKENNTDFIIQ